MSLRGKVGLIGQIRLTAVFAEFIRTKPHPWFVKSGQLAGQSNNDSGYIKSDIV